MTDMVDLPAILEDIVNAVFEGLVVILTFLYTWKDYRVMEQLLPSHSMSLMGLFLQQGRLLADILRQKFTDVDKVSFVSC